MSRTIIERIKAESDRRKRVREAILRDRRHSIPSAEKRLAPRGAAGSQNETLAGAFTREVVPVLSRAVSTEISAALDWVRRDLVSCLERELTRATSEPVPEAPPAAAEDPTEALATGDGDIPVDQTETDLDLSASEVATQLDRVFAESPPAGTVPAGTVKAKRPVGAGGSDSGHPPPSVAPRTDESTSDESTTGELTASSETETLFLEPRRAPSDPEPRRESAKEPSAETDFEKRIETEIERQIEQALADPKDLPPPPPAAAAAPDPYPPPTTEGEGAPVNGPSPPEAGLADPAGSFDPPDAGPLSVDPGPLTADAGPLSADAGPEVISSSGAIAQEVCEALVPGIASGISRVFEDIERHQEGIASRIESLGRRFEEQFATAKKAADCTVFQAIRGLQEVLVREIRELEGRMRVRLDGRRWRARALRGSSNNRRKNGIRKSRTRKRRIRKSSR